MDILAARLRTSLADGLKAHVAGVAARLPHARVLLQLDEPSLPAVLAVLLAALGLLVFGAVSCGGDMEDQEDQQEQQEEQDDD